MANEVYVSIVGRLTSDLTARVTKAGKSMATGSVAHSERIWDRQNNAFRDGDPNFYNFAIFGPDADHALRSLQKGDRVIVHGKQSIRNFERADGSRGSSVEITVDEIAPTLKFTDVQIVRTRPGAPQGAPQPAAQENAGPSPWDDNQQAAQADPFTNSGNGDSAFGGW